MKTASKTISVLAGILLSFTCLAKSVHDATETDLIDIEIYSRVNMFNDISPQLRLWANCNYIFNQAGLESTPNAIKVQIKLRNRVLILLPILDRDVSLEHLMVEYTKSYFWSAGRFNATKHASKIPEKTLAQSWADECFNIPLD